MQNLIEICSTWNCCGNQFDTLHTHDPLSTRRDFHARFCGFDNGKFSTLSSLSWENSAQQIERNNFPKPAMEFISACNSISFEIDRIWRHSLGELHVKTSKLHVAHYNSCYASIIDRLIISICKSFVALFMEVGNVAKTKSETFVDQMFYCVE